LWFATATSLAAKRIRPQRDYTRAAQRTFRCQDYAVTGALSSSWGGNEAARRSPHGRKGVGPFLESNSPAPAGFLSRAAGNIDSALTCGKGTWTCLPSGRLSQGKPGEDHPNHPSLIDSTVAYMKMTFSTEDLFSKVRIKSDRRTLDRRYQISVPSIVDKD
jgi:hypothetical protein